MGDLKKGLHDAGVDVVRIETGIRKERPRDPEPLGDAFGAEYEAYRRAVKWRMIPWVY